MNKKVQLTEKKQFCKMCFDAKRDGYDTHYLKDFTGPEVKITCPYLLGLQCNYCKEQGHTISYCPILKMKGTAPIRHQTTVRETKSTGVKIYSLYSDHRPVHYSRGEQSYDIDGPPPARPILVRQNAVFEIPGVYPLVREDTTVLDEKQEDNFWEWNEVQSKKKKTVTFTPKTQTITQPTQTQGKNTISNAYNKLFSDSDSEEEEEDRRQPVTAPAPAPHTESNSWAQIAAKVPVPVSVIKKQAAPAPTPVPASAPLTMVKPEEPLSKLASFDLKKKSPLADMFFKYTPMRSWADDSSSEDEDE